MNKILLILIIYINILNGLDFKVASYNVENLFDLHKDGTEYKEYIPYTKYWDKKRYEKKLSNISKVIKALDADIVALQEIESKKVFKILQEKTNYKYGYFLKNRSSAIGLGLFSRYKIVDTKKIVVDKYDKYARDILKAKINIKNNILVVYVNHWRSKRGSESKRIPYALALKNEIEKLTSGVDYIIVGDLNSNYDEFKSFQYDRKLNDTYGITGINQVLNTTLNKNFITIESIKNITDNLVHFNTWLELKSNERFSSKYKSQLNTPDNIILSKGMFDNKNIGYIQNSFNVFKPNYLYSNGVVNRWNKYKIKGYSDHLPIYAKFTTNQNNHFELKHQTKKETTKISYLYTIENLNSPIELKNIVVIYKANKIAIIKQKNGRAILVYNPSNLLKVGYRYDITVDKIDRYNGLKEIKAISYITKKDTNKLDQQELFKDGQLIDIKDSKYQNEVLKNLNGIYKKGYLYYKKDKKIKLYFKKGVPRPNNGQNVIIRSGHLSIYKSKIQIVIYNKDDYI